MNKKNLLSVAFLLLVGSTAVECYGQQQPVSLEVKKIDDSPIHHGFPKMPVQIPLIYQDDHLIILGTSHPEYELRIVDDNGILVYSVNIPSNTTQVVLPSWLSGQYELQLIQGNFCFYGDISL